MEVWVIYFDGVRNDRDQLWAEASVIESSGEELVIPELLWPDVAVQQDARMGIDPWEDIISMELARACLTRAPRDGFVRAANVDGDPEWRVSTDYLLTTVLGLSRERQHNNHTKRLAGIMRHLGWAHPETPMRFGKFLARGFTKPCGDEV